MITIMLPAYNEKENLQPLVTKIRVVMDRLARPYRVLVVDDGSSDGTPDLLRRLQVEVPMQVVRHKTNMGLAQTLMDGLRIAVEDADPEDVVITMDADNTHDPSHIPAMLRQLSQGYDVVIASRFEPGGQEIGLTLDRRILSRGANLLLKACFATKNVRDFTSGYRAYRAGALQRAVSFYGEQLIESTTFAATAEVLLKLHAIGMNADEVPLVLRYDLKGGTSKMQVRRTVLDYVSMIWRVWWLRWSAEVRDERRMLAAQNELPSSVVRGVEK